MPSFIPDGYEYGSGFHPVAKVHEGIEVFHRPMTPSDSATYQQEAMNESGVKLREIQAKWLIKKINRWQLPEGSDGKREQAPTLTKDLLLAGDNGMVIDQTLFSQIFATVIWGEAPDYRIGESKETDDEAVKNS